MRYLACGPKPACTGNSSPATTAAEPGIGSHFCLTEHHRPSMAIAGTKPAGGGRTVADRYDAPLSPRAHSRRSDLAPRITREAARCAQLWMESAELHTSAAKQRREAIRLLAETVMRRERLQADSWVGHWRRLAVTARDAPPA